MYSLSLIHISWIRFNPLDGKDCKNENVTDFRYALVESDDMELDKQNALIRELELPVAALVFSGKKSLHAIVRIEAADVREYKKRVEYLYSICKKNGLKLDTQNKNCLFYTSITFFKIIFKYMTHFVLENFFLMA